MFLLATVADVDGVFLFNKHVVNNYGSTHEVFSVDTRCVIES